MPASRRWGCCKAKRPVPSGQWQFDACLLILDEQGVEISGERSRQSGGFQNQQVFIICFGVPGGITAACDDYLVIAMIISLLCKSRLAALRPERGRGREYIPAETGPSEIAGNGVLAYVFLL